MRPHFVWKLKLTNADLWQTWFLGRVLSVALMEITKVSIKQKIYSIILVALGQLTNKTRRGSICLDWVKNTGGAWHQPIKSKNVVERPTPGWRVCHQCTSIQPLIHMYVWVKGSRIYEVPLNGPMNLFPIVRFQLWTNQIMKVWNDKATPTFNIRFGMEKNSWNIVVCRRGGVSNKPPRAPGSDKTRCQGSFGSVHRWTKPEY